MLTNWISDGEKFTLKQSDLMKIRDQFDPALRKNIKKKNQVAVIPIGSIEQHGAHLPISTDTDIVTEVAVCLCKKQYFLLLPTICYGVSFEHFPFFNLSIRSSTLVQILEDLCLSLSKNHIKKIIILNGHYGNLKALKRFEAKIGKKMVKTKISVISYWHYIKEDFDHAGHVETSLMLAISKNIKMKKAKKGLITNRLSKKQLSKLNNIAAKSFPQATKNGIWGNPIHASAKKGRKILKEVVDNLIKESNLAH